MILFILLFLTVALTGPLRLTSGIRTFFPTMRRGRLMLALLMLGGRWRLLLTLLTLCGRWRLLPALLMLGGRWSLLPALLMLGDRWSLLPALLMLGGRQSLLMTGAALLRLSLPSPLRRCRRFLICLRLKVRAYYGVTRLVMVISAPERLLLFRPRIPVTGILPLVDRQRRARRS
jgi:hypothetical protein